MAKPASAMVAAAFLTGVLAVAGAGAATMIFSDETHAQACFHAAKDIEKIKFGLESSIAECDAALETDLLTQRDRAGTYVNRGVLLMGKSDYRNAQGSFDTAIGLAPNLAEAYVNRGASLIGLRRFSEALADLDHALAMNPDEIEKAYYNRAIAREQLKDLRGAYLDYRKAAELRPEWEAPKRELSRFSVTHARQ